MSISSLSYWSVPDDRNNIQRDGEESGSETERWGGGGGGGGGGGRDCYMVFVWFVSPGSMWQLLIVNCFVFPQSRRSRDVQYHFFLREYFRSSSSSMKRPHSSCWKCSFNALPFKRGLSQEKNPACVSSIIPTGVFTSPTSSLWVALLRDKPWPHRP